jgi:DNA-binding LacI/PurR family transcriptional regulator
MKEVARAANVSRYTVSKVLNGDPSVRDATRKEILSVCEKLRYARNPYALNLVIKKSRTVGLIISEILNAFYGEIIEAAEREAIRQDYHLVYQCSYGEAPLEAKIAAHFRSLKVCAMIVAPVVTGENEAFWAELEKTVPVIYIDRYLKGNCHYIISDNCRSARAVTQHLLSRGRSPAYLGSAHSRLNRAIVSRERGYLNAMRAHGQAPLLIRTDRYNDRKDTEQFGYLNMQAHLESLPSPDAVFCATDSIALGAMRALAERKLALGKDVLVAGYDDLNFSPYTLPSLTTVSQPKRQMGEQAVQTAIALATSDARRKGLVQLMLRSELIVRESTGGPLSRPNHP